VFEITPGISLEVLNMVVRHGLWVTGKKIIEDVEIITFKTLFYGCG
jgi:hypothetical protein